MRHLSVIDPCAEDWERMAFAERGSPTRRCEACDREVHDLASRTRVEATALMMLSGERACLRISRDARGAIVLADGTLDAPIPGEPIRSFRAPMLAVALGATIAACTPAPPATPIANAGSVDARAASDPKAPSTAPSACSIGLVAKEQPGPSAPATATDRDGDGVLDDVDACPDVSGVAAADPQKNGCSHAIVVVSQGIVIVTPQAHFAFGSAKPDAQSVALLDAAAQVMNEHPEILRIDVEGHATPDEKDGRHLGEARARAVLAELVKRGVSASRLEAKSFGAERPIAPNTTPENRAKNRRIELKVRTD